MIKFMLRQVDVTGSVRSSRSIRERKRCTSNDKMLTGHECEFRCFFSSEKHGIAGVRLTVNLDTIVGHWRQANMSP